MVRLQVLSGLLYGHGRVLDSVCFGLKYMAPCQIGYTISTVPDTVGREVNNYLHSGSCEHLRQVSILLHFSLGRGNIIFGQSNQRSHERGFTGRGAPFRVFTVRDTKTICEGIRVPE